MAGEFDREASEESRRAADARFPIRKGTPGSEAFKCAAIASVIVGVSGTLAEQVGFAWAAMITIALSGLVAWLDCRGAYRANSRVYRDEYEWLMERKKLECAVEAEREQWRSGRS